MTVFVQNVQAFKPFKTFRAIGTSRLSTQRPISAAADQPQVELRSLRKVCSSLIGSAS